MRLMTLNIWNYTRPWDQRRELIVRLIKTYDPDVVALQECRHDWRYERGRGQGEQLADLTGYHATSVVAQVYVPLLRVDEGLTLLSRHEPLESMSRELPLHAHEREDENHRVCVGVTLLHNGKRVHIFNTHFSLSPVARLTNAIESSDFVVAAAGGETAFMMGDLNAEPDSPPIRFLSGEDSIGGQVGSFLDCWTAADPGAPGYTYGSFHPVRRIDYVFGLNVTNRVRSAEVVGTESSDGIFASDHLGIVVDVDV